MVTVFAHQAQAVEAWHHQVLQNNCRFDANRMGDGLMRVGAEVEIDILFIRQPAPNRLADHCLVVDKQDHGGILIALVIAEL